MTDKSQNADKASNTLKNEIEELIKKGSGKKKASSKVEVFQIEN